MTIKDAREELQAAALDKALVSAGAMLLALEELAEAFKDRQAGREADAGHDLDEGPRSARG